ncbi:bifunctional folylpolyglutamate synthase/dihydrofolate synthase [Camelliibacillus cellulosilyticus]|uniref:tetrahydrofolate synthase n=1 Tax=Camelliibacillus cellulosilyticus TaxID=2174486 RepID=A0ABV9GM89_9BACL
MVIDSMKTAEDLIYRSFMRAKDHMPNAGDAVTRNIGFTRKLLASIGQPDYGGRFILVTGSKGKGSTARLIASLLSHHGCRVGLFTSPHLVDFTERIRVDGRAIPEPDFIRMMNQLKDPIKEIDGALSPSQYIGPIGIALSAALVYFREKKTDINVIECGRGGRYDETNVLENQWAVLTPIMGVHLKELGPTVIDVTDHKLGIVKQATETVVVGKQMPTIEAHIRRQLPKKTVYYAGESLQATGVHLDRQGTHFTVQTDLQTYPDLKLPLLGTFQAENAAVAVKLCEAVLGMRLKRDKTRQAFASIQWPGRCEIIAQNPTVMVDGAINRESAQYLEDVVQAIGASKVVSLVAVPEDMDYQGVLAICDRFSDRIIVTEPTHSHKVFPKDAAAVARRMNPAHLAIKPLEKAVQYANTLKPDLLLIIGTQTYIGEAKKLWGQSLLDIGK